MVTKEDKKVISWSHLAKKIRKMNWVSTKVEPLVVGTFGVVSCGLEGFSKDLRIPDVLGGMQVSAVIGTTLILQKMLTL